MRATAKPRPALQKFVSETQPNVLVMTSEARAPVNTTTMGKRIHRAREAPGALCAFCSIGAKVVQDFSYVGVGGDFTRRCMVDPSLSSLFPTQRLYDTPKTPLDRLLAAHVLSQEQEAELLAHRDSLNAAAIGRQIAELQVMLLTLAKDKTEQLYLASFPSALPDIRKGIRVKAS